MKLIAYDWLVVQFQLRDWWRYVSMECGAQYVVITVGIPDILVLYVNNLGTMDVSVYLLQLYLRVCWKLYLFPTSIYSTAKQLCSLKYSINTSVVY